MGKKITLIAIILAFSAFFHADITQNTAIAQQNSDIFHTSGLPIPRFVSLRSNKVYVRTGPALRYPIKWIFKKKSLPIEIIQEFDTWRKIRDIDGEEGWIHQSLLSGKRTALISEEAGAYILRKLSENAQPAALLEKNVLVHIEKCQGAWCYITTEGFKGWIERKSIWGIYEHEELN